MSGFVCCGQIDNSSHFVDTKNATVMNIRELSDAKALECRRQIANEDVGFRDQIIVGLDQTRISRCR